MTYRGLVAASASAPAMGLELRTRPELRALPGVLHVLQMLPLTHEAVMARVERALVDNPMLGRRPGSPCPGCGRHRSSLDCPRCPGTTRRLFSDPVVSPFETLEADAGPEIRSDCRHALPIVIAHLTGRGLLDCEPAEIVALHALPAEAVAEALRAIKTVGPIGIGERSLPAVLLAQARTLVATGEATTLLLDVVGDHLAAVADDDPAAVAAALDAPVAAVTEAFRLVRTRLRPAVVVDREPSEAIRQAPDVFVYRGRAGDLEVEVADSRWFGLRQATIPAALRVDAGATAWLAVHQGAARQLLHQVDIRAAVLRQVATAAVYRQAGFFDRGPIGHVPLSRTDLAVALGLHPSTVSRAVAGKTLRCPGGEIIRFADLFGGAVAIKARITDLTHGRQMSDAQLCSALVAGGYIVARRTVAKYRAQLGISAGGYRRS